MAKPIPMQYQILNHLAMFHQRTTQRLKGIKEIWRIHMNECPFWKKGDPGLFAHGLTCDDLCHKLFNCTTCPCDFFGPQESIKRLEELLRKEGMM